MRGHELGGGQKPKTTLTISSLLPRHLPQELSGSCLHRMPLCPQPLLMPRRGALKAAIVTVSLEPASPTQSCCGAFCVPRFWHNGGLLIQKVRPDWQRATCQCPSRPGLSLACGPPHCSKRQVRKPQFPPSWRGSWDACFTFLIWKARDWMMEEYTVGPSAGLTLGCGTRTASSQLSRGSHFRAGS